MLSQILGPTLAQKLRICKGLELLPYCYVTFKDKCWQGHLRICRKLHHSCTRKIISYAQWPAKQNWKSIHRAWETILLTFGDSADTKSLDDAAHRLKHELWRLPANPACVCMRCHRDMASVEGLVADAGQFFEVVSPCQSNTEAAKLLAIFTTSSPSPVVSVRVAKKRIGWVSRPACHLSSTVRNWTASELFRAFVAASAVCVTSVGQTIFRANGLPIGGLLSKVAACIFLGGEERRWRCDIFRQRHEGYRAVQPWRNAVCHLRYVDDVFLASRLYCRLCLVYALKLIHSVPFDVAVSSPRLLWLDLAIVFPSCAVGLNVKPLVVPPPWAAPVGYLRCILLGNFRRWLFVNPCNEEWRHACVCLLRDLHDAGWCTQHVNCALFTINVMAFRDYVRYAKTAWVIIHKASKIMVTRMAFIRSVFPHLAVQSSQDFVHRCFQLLLGILSSQYGFSHVHHLGHHALRHSRALSCRLGRRIWKRRRLAPESESVQQQLRWWPLQWLSGCGDVIVGGVLGEQRQEGKEAQAQIKEAFLIVQFPLF